MFCLVREEYDVVRLGEPHDEDAVDYTKPGRLFIDKTFGQKIPFLKKTSRAAVLIYFFYLRRSWASILYIMLTMGPTSLNPRQKKSR